MQDESEGNTTETHYELACRLAGMPTAKAEPIEKEPATTTAELSEAVSLEEDVNAAPVRGAGLVDVRVTVLNNPNSILKKWRSRESVRTVLDEVIEEEQQQIQAISSDESEYGKPDLDYFFEKPKTKSFEKLFTELDQELLLDTDLHVNLDSVDNELMDVEFKPKEPRRLK